MRRLVLILAVVVVSIATISLSASPKPTSAGHWSVTWPVLLSCPDLNGDGAVSGLDLFAMISSAGSVYSPTDVNSNYLYLHDRNGDQHITLSDFMEVLGRLGDRCPLVDSQVALATNAAAKYQNCQDALDPVTGGYIQSTQFVPNMGIHLSKNVNVVPEFTGQLLNPAGLICTDSVAGGGADVPHKLIGMWYVMPMMEVCFLYPNATCSDTEPEGFDGPEDNTAMPGQQGWHTHPNLCVWGIGTEQAGTAEDVPQETCNNQPQPNFWFSEYGWMAHLYNFIPNQDGRFMMWSDLLPPPGP